MSFIGLTRATRSAAAVTLVVFAITGCATRTQTGAAVGAGVGAAAGAGVAAATGSSTTRGAIIGAVVGGAAGAVIGRQMDRQAAELERIEGAEVERVGEGIHVTFASGILFPFDSDQLLPAGRENLREFSRSLLLPENTQTHVLIAGHTDSVGTADYNQRLSERRALAASRYLQAQGVPASRITTVGRGEFEPIVSNSTESGRQQNRRVEMAIYASEAWRQELLRTGGNP